MADHIRKLAALVGSRICHDLISPIGAIQNGVELLAMEGHSGPEMALIEDSVMNASARVRYMRIAFGIAAEGQPVSRPEIQSILADMSRAGRVRYDWTLTQDCARSDAQHVFLAMMCLEAAMPRGGTILARGDDAHWLITGPAEDDRPSPALWSMLTGAEGVDPLPAQVQFALLPEILKDTGAQVEILRASSGLTLRLPRA